MINRKSDRAGFAGSRFPRYNRPGYYYAHRIQAIFHYGLETMDISQNCPAGYQPGFIEVSMKKLSVCLFGLAVLLSDIMCAVVAWNYCDMVWGIKYAGYSAPAWTAFFLAIPFAAGIVVCIALAVFFKKKTAYDL